MSKPSFLNSVTTVSHLCADVAVVIIVKVDSFVYVISCNDGKCGCHISTFIKQSRCDIR